jgi:hypothetical protein
MTKGRETPLRCELAAERNRSPVAPFKIDFAATMPPKKPRKPTRRPWQVILKQIKSDNRAVMEFMHTEVTRLDHKIDSGNAKLEEKVEDLALAVRHNSGDIKQNGADIKQLIEKVDSLTGLEERVSALERKGA